MKRLAILGSTGSIGRSTISVVETHRDRFEVVAVAAGSNIDLLREQISLHRPRLVAVSRAEDARTLARDFPGIRVVDGPRGLEEVACCPDAHMVVSALVGSVGLNPTLAAIRAGRHIALANKETLVAAGDLVTAEARRAGVDLIPVDSEHAALHQILGTSSPAEVARLVLTASGGPFHSWSARRMESASVSDALAHPTWTMGPKISVDSATMMNKGLEIIEAHHLFSIPEDRIEVVVHPESLVHSMVEFVDGTVTAQLAPNDMRFPIFHALSWPDRLPSRMASLDFTTAPPLTFESPDERRFPAPALARSALRAGGEMPAVLNAANEVAVSSFLGGHCSLPAIASTVEATLEKWAPRNRSLTGIGQVLAADREAREIARNEIGKYFPAGIGSENRC